LGKKEKKEETQEIREIRRRYKNDTDNENIIHIS
jgi:hypothetical protein